MLKVRIYNRLKKAHEDRFIYTEQEAIDLGIKYKPWIECAKDEWGLSDDGYVTELLDHRMYSNRKDYGIWVFTGGMVKRYKYYGKLEDSTEKLYVAPLLTGERKAKKIAEALKTERAKSIIRAYLLNDRRIDVAIKQIVPAAPMIEINKWRTVAKSEDFKTMVKEEIIQLLDVCGYSRQKTMLLLDEAIQMAREKKDVGGMLRAVENLFDILGFKDKDVKKETAEFSSHAIENLAEGLLEEKQTVTVSREIPFDNSVSSGHIEFNVNAE